MIRVCFVCTGNICRSPTAEAILRAQAGTAGIALEVESAGLVDHHVGQAADPRSRKAAAARGYALEGRAQQFTARDFDRFDHIIALDETHARDLRRMAPGDVERTKVRLLRSFDRQANSPSVPDPYYGGEAGFFEVITMCETACRGLLDELRQKTK